jgi:hypothetical protein
MLYSESPRRFVRPLRRRAFRRGPTVVVNGNLTGRIGVRPEDVTGCTDTMLRPNTPS